MSGFLEIMYFHDVPQYLTMFSNLKHVSTVSQHMSLPKSHFILSSKQNMTLCTYKNII